MNTPIVKSDVTDEAPELLASARPTANAWIRILNYVNKFDLTVAGEDAETDTLARIYLAAHMATMEVRATSTAAGPLTSISAGGIRRSFGLLQQYSSSASLTTTRYGQLYTELLNMSPYIGGPMVV